jgi:hypothetical protein
MKKEQLAQQIIERLTQWEASQKHQTSGYEYEKSYLEMMKEIEKEVFRQMVEAKQGEAKKKVTTSLGEMSVSREHVLLTHNESFRMSAYLQEMSCYSGQAMVFEEASEFIGKYLMIDLNAKQIERVSHHYGERIEESLREKIENGASQKHLDSDQMHYVMPDGHMLLTLEEGWKEIKMGRIFKANDRVQVNKKRTEITQSLYVAHLGDHKEFEKKMEYVIDELPKKTFISDGARYLQEWMESMYPDDIHILDYFHAKEHLCDFAKSYFGTDVDAKNKWIDEQENLLLNEDASMVINNIRLLPKTTKKGVGKQRKVLMEYYRSNIKRMNYKTYKQMGLLIGSGPIEAAHRHVIQQRMKRSGQRWTKSGLQQIANLRVVSKSNRWDEVLDMINLAA